MGTVEGFGNFNESSLYIDPNTGKVVAAKKEKKTSPDGTIIYEMSANPNDFSSIANLKNRIKSEYNKFNVSENLQSGVDDLGKRLEVIMQRVVLELGRMQNKHLVLKRLEIHI